MSQANASFPTWRAYLWPIHGYELKKFLPLFLMAFFIGFNYSVLRNMKDALLVTAESSGAEVIPFIKVWGIMPGAFLMTFLYSRLNNAMVRDRVFYTMISIFLCFFALFTFVIYPLRDYLHPHSFANYLTLTLPSGFKGMIAMLRYWTFSSFYIMSELWSSAILSMLFWGFANEVTKLGEAKRFYGLIGIGLNLAAINSGQLSVFITGSYVRDNLHLTENPWHQSVILLTLVILFSGGMILATYRYLTKHVLPFTDKETIESQKREKIKMSMRENFAFLARSRYLLLTALIVLSYNIVINLVEVIWKDQVRQLYPDSNDFFHYMSQIGTITGIISFFTSLLVTGQVIRRFGWTVAAAITPVILLATSACFFFFFFGGSTLSSVLINFGTSPLSLVVFFGSAQNCLCRAAKFTLFDPTKEMAFIPLDVATKLKGKTAIDGIGSRVGKSTGSVIHQALLLSFTTVSASAHFVAFIVIGVISIWLYAILSLGKQFTLLSTATTEGLTLNPEPAKIRPQEEPATV